MKTEFTQDEADALTSEQIGELGATVEGFMRRHGLTFGYTLLAFDRNGIKTMGNMGPEAQRELFGFVAGQLGTVGPDDMETMKLPDEPATH